MIYREAQPSPTLAPFVECYWHVHATPEEELDSPQVLIPTGQINLIFNLGHPHRFRNRLQSRSWGESRRCWISGLTTEAMIVQATCGTNVVGVRFRPGGLGPFLRVPASEFSGNVIEMDGVWGRLHDETCERLHQSDSVQAMFAVLERFLLDRIHGGLVMNQRIRHALRLLSPGLSISIREVEQSLGITNRHLNRLFLQHVGLSPKSFSRLHRFRTVIAALDTQPNPDWSDLALACGYYDQAHFIAEFRQFCGLTPTSFQSKKSAYDNWISL